MASGAGKNRMLKQKRYFRTRMTPSHSLMATDGALKFKYASVIFVDPAVQIDEISFSNLILLPQLLYAIHKVSGSLHLSKTGLAHTKC